MWTNNQAISTFKAELGIWWVFSQAIRATHVDPAFRALVQVATNRYKNPAYAFEDEKTHIIVQHCMKICGTF